MNSNTPFILFILYSIGYLVIFAITNNLLGMIIISMFSVLEVVINEKLNKIEDLLREYGGD